MKHHTHTPIGQCKTILRKLFISIFFLALVSANTACHHAAYDYSQRENLVFKEARTSLFPDYEKIDFIYTEGDGVTPRSKVTQIIERQQGTNFYVISSHGEGNYDTYKDVVWEMKNNFQVRDNLVYCINSRATINDKKTGNLLVTSEKNFDYQSNKIICTLVDSKGTTTKKKVFPLKKPVVESALLPYFLKPFISLEHRDPDTSVYVLTEALNLYRMSLKFSQPEQIALANGTTSAIRVQLIPSLGPLTILDRMIAPNTYIWYSADESRDWLKFEGLEADIGTKLIKGYSVTSKPTPSGTADVKKE